jgi:hypothetical protein
VHLFRIQALRQSGGVGEITEHDTDVLSLALECASCPEDALSQMSRRVGSRLLRNRRGLRRGGLLDFGAGLAERCPAPVAE